MLVVGDDEPSRVAALLSVCGVEARAASGPGQALQEFLQRGAPFGPNTPPNAIVINVKHDREALVRSFKENPATSRLPVLVLSADASAAHRLSMYEAGASLFLVRHPEPERLAQDLARLAEFWCGLVLPPPSLVEREA